MIIYKINILKIDIDGTEYELFNHLDTLKFIKRNVRYLFVEYHEDTVLNKDWIVKKLSNFQMLNDSQNVLTFVNNKEFKNNF